MTTAKITCETPTPGKKPTRIAKWKYEAVRAAILAPLPERGEGLPFAELADCVHRHLESDTLGRLGSVKWYTTTVKLHLEVRGEIKRVLGSRPQRLLRCRSNSLNSAVCN
jgi:hypothetical protein